MTCDNCGGSGIDIGSLNMEYPDDCRICDGSGCEPGDYDDTGDIEGREERERILAAWA